MYLHCIYFAIEVRKECIILSSWHSKS